MKGHITLVNPDKVRSRAGDVYKEVYDSKTSKLLVICFDDNNSKASLNLSFTGELFKDNNILCLTHIKQRSKGGGYDLISTQSHGIVYKVSNENITLLIEKGENRKSTHLLQLNIYTVDESSLTKTLVFEKEFQMRILKHIIRKVGIFTKPKTSYSFEVQDIYDPEPFKEEDAPDQNKKRKRKNDTIDDTNKKQKICKSLQYNIATTPIAQEDEFNEEDLELEALKLRHQNLVQKQLLLASKLKKLIETAKQYEFVPNVNYNNQVMDIKAQVEEYDTLYDLIVI